MTTAAPNGNVEGIPWDLSDEYPAADAPEVERDLDRLDAVQDALEAANRVLVPLLDTAGTLALDDAAEGHRRRAPRPPPWRRKAPACCAIRACTRAAA